MKTSVEHKNWNALWLNLSIEQIEFGGEWSAEISVSQSQYSTTGVCVCVFYFEIGPN